MIIHPLYRNRKQEKTEIRMFAYGLYEIYKALTRLRSIDFAKSKNVIYYTNIAQDCKRYANMYETSELFVPEVAHEDGFKADRYFYNCKANPQHFGIPDYLRYASALIEDIIDEKEREDELEYVESFLRTFLKYIILLREDYGIQKDKWNL